MMSSCQSWMSEMRETPVVYNCTGVDGQTSKLCQPYTNAHARTQTHMHANPCKPATWSRFELLKNFTQKPSNLIITPIHSIFLQLSWENFPLYRLPFCLFRNGDEVLIGKPFLRLSALGRRHKVKPLVLGRVKVLSNSGSNYPRYKTC